MCLVSAITDFIIAAAVINPSYDLLPEEGLAKVTMDVSGGSPKVTNHSWSFNHGGQDVRMTAGDSFEVYRALDPVVSTHTALRL